MSGISIHIAEQPTINQVLRRVQQTVIGLTVVSNEQTYRQSDLYRLSATLSVVLTTELWSKRQTYSAYAADVSHP